jgi:acetoin utilization protein AcuB
MEYKIENFMTKSPRTVSAYQKLAFAESLMEDLKIRHLPVLKDDELIGVLSLRDIRLVQGIDSDYKKIAVEEACVEDPIMVQKDEDVRAVCKDMLKKKIGSVMVMNKEKLVGIFTSIDALALISSLK